ncbi:porphobilinogen synthase [Desulfonatronovibrio hydrogenovorans]|uniref:porphobilinogen synthase n=1 Tax=Desulfonatronovibrio hydrogenovorans TaxID=53245 RepID=UPI00048DABAE|nr:porphobilinogen synthase [Desulfonatronovibrio hydrogenovorans]
MSLFFRGRRLRKTPAIRGLVRENLINPKDLVQPYFVLDGVEPDFEKPIASMPGQSQLGLASLKKRVAKDVNLGLTAVILFGIPEHKDGTASQGYAPDGIIQKAVAELKSDFPDLVVITDVCLCEYMDHGHCGIIEKGKVLNDQSLELLGSTALSHARAGADMVAPSDMMDGRVSHIRKVLDQEGFLDLPIMSYAVKYASAYYGPFRDAAHSAPAFGDRKTYQMDPANSREAMREAQADINEGADILMVKPALPYLDIIRDLRHNFTLPVAAYHVSGEYSLIKAGAGLGHIDEKKIVMESMTSIKRAGAEIIITYYAREILSWLKENQ